MHMRWSCFFRFYHHSEWCSVFEPVLFLIYINNICDVFNHYGNQRLSKLFADDVKFYLDITCAQFCDILQKALIDLQTWAKNWQLTVSSTRCPIMSIGRQNVRRLPLPIVTPTTDLGINFDFNVKFPSIFSDHSLVTSEFLFGASEESSARMTVSKSEWNALNVDAFRSDLRSSRFYTNAPETFQHFSMPTTKHYSHYQRSCGPKSHFVS